MARLKRCDLCGAEADELMSIDFPYEERWMLFFHKRSLAHYADLCLDCLEKIRAERQAQIKANEVDFEIADTPQTDKDKVVCPNCGRSDYIRSFEKDFNIKNSEYRYKCINCNTYIKDTPQTDCGWK